MPQLPVAMRGIWRGLWHGCHAPTMFPQSQVPKLSYLGVVCVFSYIAGHSIGPSESRPYPCRAPLNTYPPNQGLSELTTLDSACLFAGPANFHSFTHFSFTYSFVHSFIHPFIHLFIRSFICSLTFSAPGPPAMSCASVERGKGRARPYGRGGLHSSSTFHFTLGKVVIILWASCDYSSTFLPTPKCQQPLYLSLPLNSRTLTRCLNPFATLGKAHGTLRPEHSL